MNRLSLWFGVASILTYAACTVDHDAASVELQFASAPSSSCQYSVGTLSQLTGFFDPVQPNNGWYQLVFQVRNNMLLASNDAQTYGPLSNARDQGTGVNMVGFEGCWYLFDGTPAEFGANSSGAYVDCTTIPLQAGSLPATSQVDAGLIQSLVGTNVLTGSHLKAIFGSDFDIDAVAGDPSNYVGPQYDGVTGRVKNVPILKAPGPAGGGRAAGWGQNYPATLSATIVVQLRAIYTKQGGGTGYTNWVSYPIEFCPTCLNNVCGDNIYKSCGTLQCPTSGPCPTSGICPENGVGCAPYYYPAFGQVSYVDWGAGTACLPAQGDTTTITCTTITVSDPNCPIAAN